MIVRDVVPYQFYTKMQLAIRVTEIMSCTESTLSQLYSGKTRIPSSSTLVDELIVHFYTQLRNEIIR
jgi:hypothetical protein